MEVKIPIANVTKVERKNTALVFPNGTLQFVAAVGATELGSLRARVVDCAAVFATLIASSHRNHHQGRYIGMSSLLSLSSVRVRVVVFGSC